MKFFFNLKKKASHHLRFDIRNNIPKVVNDISEEIFIFMRKLLNNEQLYSTPSWEFNLKKNYGMSDGLIKIELLFDEYEYAARYEDFGPQENLGWSRIECIFIYVYTFINKLNLNRENIDSYEEYLKESIKSSLIHELTHVIDPKKYLEKNKDIEYGQTNVETEIEFDAYCQDVCFKIAKYLKENEESDIEIATWIRNGDLLHPPDFIKAYLPIFKSWAKNEIFKRRFFLKLYNDLYSDEKNIFAKMEANIKKNSWTDVGYNIIT